MSGVKDNDLKGHNGQRKHRRTVRPWGRILADRGAQRLAFFGVPSHWHQENLEQETKEKAERPAELAKS